MKKIYLEESQERGLVYPSRWTESKNIEPDLNGYEYSGFWAELPEDCYLDNVGVVRMDSDDSEVFGFPIFLEGENSPCGTSGMKS